MRIEELTSVHKPAMKGIVEEVIAYQGLLPEFYWPKDLLGAEVASAEAVGIFVDDVLAGFILYRVLPDAWDISLVVTSPQYRRQGLMEVLLRHLIAAKGHERQIWLEVHPNNISAQNLYEKLGFTMTGRRPRYYQDGSPALLYSYY